MPEAYHSYRPADGHSLRGDPFNSIVGPRPIGWISTIAANGVKNLAPYSFFNAFNYRPPMIGFASIGFKHTVSNIRANGQFVWNLATRALADQMNASSSEGDEDVDEFALAGLSCLPSEIVEPPRVAETPVSFECRLSDLHRLRDAAGSALDTWLIIGEVVMIHIREDMLIDGQYDTALAHPILRGGGPAEYFEIDGRGRFEMRRPRPAPPLAQKGPGNA